MVEKKGGQREEEKKSHKLVFENEGAGVVVTWTGDITGEEIRGVNDYIYAKGRLEKLRYQILDFSTAGRILIENQELRDFALQDRSAARTNPDQVVAIIGNAEFFKGYDRLYHIYEEVWAGFKSRSFPTMAEARKWISAIYPQQ